MKIFSCKFLPSGKMWLTYFRIGGNTSASWRETSHSSATCTQ